MNVQIYQQKYMSIRIWFTVLAPLSHIPDAGTLQFIYTFVEIHEIFCWYCFCLANFFV